MIKPLNEYVLVSENEAKKQTESGIMLVDSGQYADTKTARVIAVGPDVTKVQEGQNCFVIWSKGVTVKHEGKLVALIKQEDVIAVVE